MEINGIDLIKNKNDEYLDELFDEQINLSNHSQIAGMDEIVVSNEDKYIIGTTALDTCTGILFYDRVNKKGIVGHASPSNSVAIIIEMLKRINTTKKAVIEYGFVSGYRTTEKKDFIAIDIFKEYMDVFSKLYPNIKFTPISIDFKMCDEFPAYEFAFNTQTGKSENLIFNSNILGKHR